LNETACESAYIDSIDDYYMCAYNITDDTCNNGAIPCQTTTTSTTTTTLKQLWAVGTCPNNSTQEEIFFGICVLILFGFAFINFIILRIPIFYILIGCGFIVLGFALVSCLWMLAAISFICGIFFFLYSIMEK
jgi:hypothetical protein